MSFFSTFTRIATGKSDGKTKIFQGQGKVREFRKKSKKFFDFVKVSEKSGALLVKSNILRTKAKSGKGLKMKRKISMARKKS